MSWKIPRMWEGGDVWIIGGGPSIPRQFGVPEKVIKQVIDGISPPSVYSSYMRDIHGKHVIGINMAYRLGDWIDLIVFGDTGFYLRERNDLAKFPGIKVSCSSNAKQDSWIKYVARDSTHVKGISPNPSLVSWNGNTGAVAINLAAHAGAKRIILLGFDMNLDSSSKFQHWHNLYNKGPVQDDRRARKLPFDRHMRSFPAIAEDARKMHIEILNASPSSSIDCFPKVTVKQLIYGEI